MARLKKNITFDASDETILDFFDQAMSLKDQQKESSAEISALNSIMAEAGVDPGTLSTCCRLARMKPGKRGISVALLHRYLSILASRLEDPTMPNSEAEVRPFERAPGAAAA